MKIIFLDFDGVLNSVQDSIMYRRLGGDFGMKMSPLACSNIQWLLDQDKDVKIVISSTWRVLHTLSELKIILSVNNVDGNRVIGVTPDREVDLIEGMSRGSQIKRWLNDNQDKNITHYCIIDDDNDMLIEQQDNFVHTTFLTGFMMGDAIKAAKLLGINTDLIAYSWY